MAAVHGARQRFFRRFLLDFCLISVQLLCDFKFALLNEVYAVDGTSTFTIDFLASDELCGPHLLKDVLHGLAPQLGEDAETAEKCDYLLQFSLLLLLHRPLEVLARERGEICSLRALDRGSTCRLHFIEQGELAEAETLSDFGHSRQAINLDLPLLCSMSDAFEQLRVDA